MRSFVAVDLEDPTIREHIIAAQQGLEQTRASLKIVDPNIMHMTLRFLGEVPLPTVQKIVEAMNEVRFRTFEAQFTGVGVFPNIRRISVVWVGMARGHEELNDIFRQLEPKLQKIGLPSDNKGFSPHMTIARVRSGLNRDALAQYVEKMRDYEFGKMTVSAVRLKKSTLTPKGPIYSTLHEVKAYS